MFEKLLNFLQKKNINLLGAVPLSACRVIRPYLLERANIQNGTVFVMAVPYFTTACEDTERCISAYAVPRDYHLFFEELYKELLPYLAECFPANRFAAFADHSPISELHAAACAGLGVIGKNGLLLTERYGSYVFLGEIITNAALTSYAREISHCIDCKKCVNTCPVNLKIEGCLSAITQKKGELSKNEITAIQKNHCAWGCDTCQEVCPYTVSAIKNGTIFTNIDFFKNDLDPVISTALINSMSDEMFSQKAYSWRGKNVILRNLKILEDKES